MPVHLGVHVLGLAVAAGLVAMALHERGERPGRVGVSVGGVLLLVSHLVTGAMLAEPAGWPMLLRTGGYAALAVGAAGRVVRGPLMVMALAPVAHLAAGVAGLAAAVAASRGVLGRGRHAAPLAGGVALWAVGDLVVPARPGLAVALSVAGSLAVGGWVLVRATRTSLAGRFVGAAMTLMLLLTVALGSASGVLYTTDLQAEQAERLQSVAGARAAQFGDAWPRELETTATLLTGARLRSDVAEAEEAGDLDDRTATVASLPGIDVAVVVGRDGEPLGTARPAGELTAADAATLAAARAIGAALAGDSARGLVPVGEGELLAVGTAPVAPISEGGRSDRAAAALLVGRVVTADAVVETAAADTGADAALVVDDLPAASTLPTAAGPDLAGVSAGGTARIAGEDRTVAAAPLSDDGVGRLVLALPAQAVTEVAEAATRSTFLVAAAGLLAAGGLAVAVSRRVTGPVRRLTAAAERVATGEYPAGVAIDSRDEVGRLATAFDDMTLRLGRRERELREAATTQGTLRRRLEAVTSAMGEALVAVDGAGLVTLANPAAEALLDPRADGLLGRPVADVLLGVAEGGLQLVEEAGTPSGCGPAPASGSSSTRGMLPDGRLVAVTAAPLQDDRGGTGRVYVLRDVTAEVAADRLRTEIVANVSHELRTPLTPIIGYLELLRGRDLPGQRVRDFAGQAADAATRLQRVIEKFIDLADLEAGNTPVVAEQVRVDDLLRRTAAGWGERLPERRITREVGSDLPPVRTDPRLLGRVLDELVENAAKFSDGPIRLLAHEDGAGRVRVMVRDEGEGIDAGEVDRVLADFEQADGSATRRVGGVGLGLSIVQRVLPRLDAELDLEPAPGGGTDATLTLPTASF